MQVQTGHKPFAARMVRDPSERCLNREPSTRVLFFRTLSGACALSEAEAPLPDADLRGPNALWPNAVRVLELVAISTPGGCRACLTKPSNKALLTHSPEADEGLRRVSPGYFALRALEIAVAS